MANVKIITDSACDLAAEELERFNITVVPLTIRFDNEEFIDGVELSNEKFWEKANASATLPSTAAPSPGSFEQAFRQAKAEGHDAVVCITLAAGLSATNQAAVGGAALAKDDVEVHVVDSLSCTVAQAQICLLAAESAMAGATARDIAAYAQELASKQQLLGVLDTIENLRKGGRIGAAGAFFATLLSVKPIITIINGEVKPLAKQRTRSRATRYLADLVIAEGPISNVGVSHSNAPDVEAFIEMLHPVVKREDVLLTQMGPTIGVHGGPGLIAVTFSKDK